MRPKKWFYVQCEETQGAPYYFSHTTVYSTTREGAITAGREYFKSAEDSHNGRALLNDYVIEANA